MDYSTIISAALRSPGQKRRDAEWGKSVMSQPVEPAWQPEYVKEPPLESVSPEDLVPSPKSIIAALKGVGTMGGAVGAIKRLHHGGTYTPGTPIKDVLYAHPDPRFAETYVDATKGGTPALKSFDVDLDDARAVPRHLVGYTALKHGIDNAGYTPASVFDSNLHDPVAIGKVIAELRGLGYTHAKLKDIPMTQLSGDVEDAYALFPGVITK